MVAPLQQQERYALFAEKSVWGVEVLNCSLYAAAPDRPVWQAWYNLPITPQLEEQLQMIFGPPTQQKEYVVSYPAGQVRRTLGWEKGDVYVGVSIFAQPRPEAAGFAAAAFTLHWENELAAAQPYLPAYVNQEKWLAGQAERVQLLAQITLEEEQQPFFVTNYRRYTLAQTKADATLRQAQRVLYKRHLFGTPAGVSQKLTPNEVWVWRNPAETFWAVSTVWETAVFEPEQKVQATLLNILPAKGGGGTHFQIGDLVLRSRANSAGVKQLAELVQKGGLAEVVYQEEYDY